MGGAPRGYEIWELFAALLIEGASGASTWWLNPRSQWMHSRISGMTRGITGVLVKVCAGAPIAAAG